MKHVKDRWRYLHGMPFYDGAVQILSTRIPV